jgi:hypothetical protein
MWTGMLSFSPYIILVLIKWLQWLHNIKKAKSPSHFSGNHFHLGGGCLWFQVAMHLI